MRTAVLYREHPDWALTMQKALQEAGQLVLDMSK